MVLLLFLFGILQMEPAVVVFGINILDLIKEIHVLDQQFMGIVGFIFILRMHQSLLLHQLPQPPRQQPADTLLMIFVQLLLLMDIPRLSLEQSVTVPLME